MMSLLLTFFIMLVSMSAMKEDGDMRAMLNAVKEAFGADMGAFGAPGPSRQKSSALDKLNSLGSRSQGGDKKSNPDNKGAGGRNKPVRSMAKGPLISLGGPALFPRFEAELSPELEQQLQAIFDTLNGKQQMIEIRGHASPEPLPPDSEYADLMELSFARSHLVVRWLIKAGMPEHQLLVTAAGEVEPLHQTSDAARRQLNDRVDVFLTEAYIAPSDQPGNR